MTQAGRGLLDLTHGINRKADRRLERRAHTEAPLPVRVCARARVRECMRAYVRAYVRTCAGACVRAFQWLLPGVVTVTMLVPCGAVALLSVMIRMRMLSMAKMTPRVLSVRSRPTNRA